MGVLDVGVADQQREEDDVGVPLRLLQLGRAQDEKPAGDHVENGDADQNHTRPGGDPGDDREEAVDEVADGGKRAHGSPEIAAGPSRPTLRRRGAEARTLSPPRRPIKSGKRAQFK